MSIEDKRNIKTLKGYLSSLCNLRKGNLAHLFSVKVVYDKIHDLTNSIYKLNLRFLIDPLNDLFDFPMIEYGNVMKHNYKLYLRDMSLPNFKFVPPLPADWGNKTKAGLEKITNTKTLYYTGYHYNKPDCVHKANHKDLQKVLNRDINDVKELYTDLI